MFYIEEKNIMNKNNKYRGAIQTAVLHVLINGVVLGCVLELLSLFILMFFQSEPLYRLYGIFHWPMGFLCGMIISAGIVLLRWTTVEIRDERIIIRSVGYRRSFGLPQFKDSSVIRKTHIGSYSKYTTVKCYLVFASPQGDCTCRLYGFGEKELEDVLGAVRNARAEHMTYEEKSAMIKEYSDEVSEALIQGRTGENEFLLPAAALIRKEKDYLKKIALITAGVVTMTGLLDAREILIDHTFSLQLLFLTILAIGMLACVIVLYAGLEWKRRICAERIVVDGEHLLVGRQYYSYAGLKAVCLTSPRKRNSSVLPVQRYMYIFAAGKRRKYWLGSEASFGAYDRLCRCLEEGMILYPGILRYR